MMKNFYWLEPDLQSHGCHMYTTTSIFYETFKKLNIKDINIKFVVSNLCEVDIKNNLNAEILYDSYRNIGYSGFWSFLTREIRLSFWNFIALRRLVKKNNGQSICYFNTVQSYHLFSIFFALLFYGNKFHKFIATLRMSNRRSNGDKSKRFILYQFSLFLLKFFNKKIIYVTDSELLKAEFSADFKIDAAVLCIPHVPVPLTSSNITLSANQITIGILGGVRESKNSIDVAKALVDLEKFHYDSMKNLKFIFHNFGPLNPVISKYLANASKLNIVVRADALDDAMYYDDINNCDVILLHYSPDFYHSVTSGVFLEAVCLGKHVIVSNNTWMSDQCIRYNFGQVIYEDKIDKESILNSILFVKDNLNNFNKRSLQISHFYRSFHSPQKFVCELLDLVVT